MYKTGNSGIGDKTENPKVPHLRTFLVLPTELGAFPASSTDTGMLTHLCSQGQICALGVRNSLLAHQVALHTLRRMFLEVVWVFY